MAPGGWNPLKKCPSAPGPFWPPYWAASKDVNFIDWFRLQKALDRKQSERENRNLVWWRRQSRDNPENTCSLTFLMMWPMTQLMTTNNQQHVSNVSDNVGLTLLHLSPNVITLRSLLHLRAVITLRSSTNANSCISSSIYNLFNITSSYLYVAESKKRAAVLKMFNRSHKSKITRWNSAAPLPQRELFTQRISGFSDSRFLSCDLVEIEDVITPPKITLFKYTSWTEQQIRCRRKCRYFDICHILSILIS